ncbi:MAG: glycoside hydrolase domain-containing protein [Armatimonadota bacterium]
MTVWRSVSGFNYSYKSQARQLIDPFVVTDGLLWPGWAYGDTTLVYPGECGPLESIRGQVFAESLQDLALLQTADLDPNGKLLAPLNDFCDYPKDEAWHWQARAQVLKGLK